MQGIRKNLFGEALAVACMATVTGACGDAPEPSMPSSLLPAPAAPAAGCGDRGYVRTTFYGAFDGEIDWSTNDLDCEGMPRPGGEGARLRFAGSAGKLAISIIIAIPTLERGAAAEELASNVTLIEEGSGRFFSTSGLGNCWTNIDEQTGIEDRGSTYSVAGTLYCISPLAEVNGTSSVSLGELEFAGLLDWSAT